MTILYLIRHSVKYGRGEINYYNVPDNKNIKDEKTFLSVEGEKRAEILSKELELQNIDVIYTSNMVRSMQTAKYFCDREGLNMIVDERLNERKLGKENSEEYPDWYERQYLYEDFKTEGGESQKEVCNRVHEAIKEILKNNQNKRIAVFTHGYAITFAILKWCELVNVTHDRKLTIKYKGKIIMDKIINAPEVFKLTFDDMDELIDIDLIEFDDLPFMKGGV